MPAAELITILEISHLPMSSIISSSSNHLGLPTAIVPELRKAALVRSELQRMFTHFLPFSHSSRALLRFKRKTR
jgi:hypothetical protein